MVSGKRENCQTEEEILYYKHFGRRSLFKGSGYQFGTNTTWCEPKSKLQMMIQNVPSTQLEGENSAGKLLWTAF